MEDFRAYRIDQQDGKIVAGFTNLCVDDLSAGEVLIKVSHSTINYKDALAATGAGKILRTFPLVGGIDLAGTVVSSEDERFSERDAVLVNGCGLGETCDGGYAEYARVSADSVGSLNLITCGSPDAARIPELRPHNFRNLLSRIRRFRKTGW